jgi:hypothetical protein
MNKADDVFDIWFAYYNKEIGLHQLNRMLKDLGWTDDEIDEALADGDDDEA